MPRIDPADVIRTLTTFIANQTWFLESYVEAERRAHVDAYGSDKPLASATAAFRAGLAGKTPSKPNVAKFLPGDEEYREHLMELLAARDELARAADAWGFDNGPLVVYATKCAPYFHETPADLDALLEQLGIRAENLLDSGADNNQKAAQHTGLRETEQLIVTTIRNAESPITTIEELAAATLIAEVGTWFHGTPRD